MSARRSRRTLLVMVAIATCGACQDSTVAPGPGWAGTLDVDIRDQVDVELLDKAVDEFTVTLAFRSRTHQPFDPATRLQAAGRVEHIPEAATDLYVARIPSASVEGGPCGAQPMSLALSLARRENNARVGGGLTIYCGQGAWSGVPARILRLSGQLPRRAQ